MLIFHISGASYHLDDVDISLAGQGAQVDTYLVPPKSIADTLVQSYFATVHPLIPVVAQNAFMEHYNEMYSSGNAFSISGHWLMITNLVFANGARFHETMGHRIDWSHKDFFSRARVLGALDGGALFGIPTLRDVQAIALAGMYLLGTKRTNRLVFLLF
jgi:hypothetical protein